MHGFLLRPVLYSEMTMIYRWRNEPRVRAVMPYAGEIDFAVHKQWWPKAIEDPERRMLIVEDRGRPAAVIVFLEVRPGVSAKWGFYTAPRGEISKAQSLRAWIVCELAAIVYAFENLRLETLYCEIIETNTAVLRLSDRIGFEATGKKLFVAGRYPFIEMKFTRANYEKRPSLFDPVARTVLPSAPFVLSASNRRRQEDGMGGLSKGPLP